MKGFISNGSYIWQRFDRLLQSCELSMWEAMKRGGVRSGGIEFIDLIFGRDRDLKMTEEIMAAIRLWNVRFDAEYEDVFYAI